MSLWKYFLEVCERWLSQSPRFAKYQPAPRLGTRRVECRLLRRLALTAAESAR